MKQRIKQTIENLERINLESLKGAKNLMMIVFFGILFGVYWYLGWKKLGVALLLASMGILTLLLVLEMRKKAEKEVADIMARKCVYCKCADCDCECHDIKKEDKEEKKEEDSGGFGLGMDLGEHDKRMQESIGY